RIAADDQLLLPCAFQFQPVTRAAADVGPVGALGDQPFPPGMARVGESALRVAAPRVAEPQGWPRPHGLRQARATLEQRAAGEVLAVELEQVEHAIDDWVRGDQRRGRLADAKALLEPRERGLLAVEGDELPVEHQPPRALRRDCPVHLGIRAGKALAGAGLELDGAAGLARHAALTVELPLQQPLITKIALVSERREHQRPRHATIIHDTRIRHDPRGPGSYEASSLSRIARGGSPMPPCSRCRPTPLR